MTSAASLAERLRQAASAGHADQVHELCDLGAKIEPDLEGRTALHLAAANGHVDTAKALLQAGAKVNALDAAGYSPLHQAATEGHEEMVKLLLKNGCHVDTQDELHGNTALHEAAWKGYSKTLEAICKNRANVYIRNKGGFSPLHLACQNGHNQSCRVLLLAACKPDIRNNYGDTPLHTSARYGHAGVLRILISAFCCVSEKNKNGDTALHIAAAMGRRKLTKILLEAGCEQTIVNNQGETARDIAERKGFTEVVEILTNPPVTIIQVQDSKKQPQNGKSSQKKREKDSGTSQESASKEKKEKHKKSKKGHKVHFSTDDLQKRNVSPYGCHMFPNLASFPSPKLDSLPAEPLKTGEQYYVDLAGNIKKGPVGLGYMCYCAPFFHHVEKKMDADKQELMDHIDSAHEDLNAKISHLEQRTHDQLFNLNQKMKESLALERTECSERMERRVLRERHELEHYQENNAQSLRSELKTWMQSHFGMPNGHHVMTGITRCQNQSSGSALARSRSADLLSEADTNHNSTVVHSGTVTDEFHNMGNGQVHLDYRQRMQMDPENCGARPKYADTRPPPKASRLKTKCHGYAGLKRDSRSEGDLTSCHTATTENGLPYSPHFPVNSQSKYSSNDKSFLSILDFNKMKHPSASKYKPTHIHPSIADSTEGNTDVSGPLWNKSRQVTEYPFHKNNRQGRLEEQLDKSAWLYSNTNYKTKLPGEQHVANSPLGKDYDRRQVGSVSQAIQPGGSYSPMAKKSDHRQAVSGVPLRTSQTYLAQAMPAEEHHGESVTLPLENDGSSFV